MAFVAAKTSTSTSHAKTSVNHLNMLRRDLLETSLGVTRSGEPEAGTKSRRRSKKSITVVPNSFTTTGPTPGSLSSPLSRSPLRTRPNRSLVWHLSLRDPGALSARMASPQTPWSRASPPPLQLERFTPGEQPQSPYLQPASQGIASFS